MIKKPTLLRCLCSSLLVFSLGACSSLPSSPAIPGTLEGVDSQVSIDQRLLVPCDPPTDLVENAKPSDVLLQHAEDVLLIYCWEKKHNALSNVVRRAFNLSE